MRFFLWMALVGAGAGAAARRDATALAPGERKRPPRLARRAVRGGPGRVVLVQRRRRVGVVVVEAGRPAQRRHGSAASVIWFHSGGVAFQGRRGRRGRPAGSWWRRAGQRACGSPLAVGNAVCKRGARAVAAGRGRAGAPGPARGARRAPPTAVLAFYWNPPPAPTATSPAAAAAASPGRSPPPPPRRAPRLPTADRIPNSQRRPTCSPPSPPPRSASAASALDVEEPSLPRPRRRPLARWRRRAGLPFRSPRGQMPARGRAGGQGLAARAGAVRNFMLKMPTADGYAWVTGNCVVWRRDILYTYGGGITLKHTITDRAELERYDPWRSRPASTTRRGSTRCTARPSRSRSGARRARVRRPARASGARWRRARTRNLRVCLELRIELGFYR